MSIATQIASWAAARWLGGGALANRSGTQLSAPAQTIVEGAKAVNEETSLQLPTVWAALDRRASVIASLPLYVYRRSKARARAKEPAVGSELWDLLTESPNARMTPTDFWKAMILNYDLRGNAYARIVRKARLPGEPIGPAASIWPMAANQVEQWVDSLGEVWYIYRIENETFVLPAEDVLHIKNLGNGTNGFDKLAFMSPTIAEGTAQVAAGFKTFSSGGKPTAVLMTDRVLQKEQRLALQERFLEMQTGNNSRLFVLEAAMKYQQLSATAEEQQLLESRKLSGEDLCRFIDVPPALVYHSNATAWGTGIGEINAGWVKYAVAPLCTSIEQAVRKSVFTPKQRIDFEARFDLDQLLRGSPKERTEIGATRVQNALTTRDEWRLDEDFPEMGGGAAILTAQSNLWPLDLLGKQAPAAGADAETAPAIAQ